MTHRFNQKSGNTRIRRGDSESALTEALSALRSGQLVAFPTDTVYGVGCDAWSAGAIERLYWAKRRPKSMAIPVLVSAPEYVKRVASALPSALDALVERFWPGGLTLVVPRAPTLPELLCAGKPSVAVRMPAHPLALRLIAGMGGALAATSANLSGNPSPKTAAEVLTDLEDRVAIILDGGECPGGIASSIVDLVADPPVLVRRGSLDVGILREALPHLVVPARLADR